MFADGTTRNGMELVTGWHTEKGIHRATLCVQYQ